MNHTSPSVVRDNTRFDKVLLLTVGLLLLTGCAYLGTRSVDDMFAQIEARGEQEYSRGQFERARDDWQHGLQLARQHGRSDRQASFLTNLARVDEESGNYQEAWQQAARAVEMARGIPDDSLEGYALVEVAQAQRRLSNYTGAKQNSERALQIARQLNDQRLECHALRGLGAVADSEGKRDDAIHHYEESLTAARAARDPTCEAQTLNNLGGLYRSVAKYETAIKYYEDSLGLRRQIRDLHGQAKVLGNLCNVHEQLNDYEAAKTDCEQSLKIARKLGARATEANNLNNLGALHRHLGDLDSAVSYYERALAIKRQIRDRAGEAKTLNNLGEICWQLNRYDEATKYLQRSLEITTRIGDLSGQSATHQNLGSLARDRGDNEAANEHFQRALILAVETRTPEVRWRAFDGLSRVAAARGNRPLAIFLGKQAVNTIQSMRGNIANLEQTLQRSFLEDKVRVYKRLADLLIEEGRLWEAEQVLAMLKEEEYLYFVRGPAGTAASTTEALLNGSEEDRRDVYEDLVNKLAEIRSAYAELEQKEQRSGLTPEEQRRLDELAEQLKVLRKNFNAYLDELEKYFTALNKPEISEEFGEKQLKSLKSLQGTLHEVSRRAGKTAVLVHYLVMPDQLRMIVTGPDLSIPPIHRESPIGEQELNRRVAEYRLALGNPHGDDLPQSRALYEVLIAPILDVLEALKADILMVYLDGVLRYLPIAALRGGERYLVEDYAVVVYTSAAASNLAATRRKDARVAALGVSQAYGDFPPLPFVAEELDAVVKTGGILPGAEYLDDAFTAKRLEDVLNKEDANGDKFYPVVHLATHFSFLPGTKNESFLMLGQGKRLSLADLDESDYHLAGLDLLTLSACETALGASDATGREVEGLGTLAQNNGARAVLATLWKVSDPSTAAFMGQFYRNRQEGGDTKVEALRKTQVAFIRGKVVDTRGAPGRGRGEVLVDGPAESLREGWTHPYYWAPFILMGNFL